MTSIIFTPKDIFDADFKTSVRGYNKQDVDEFLDEVIKDYETYDALVNELRAENERLREKLAAKPVVETPPIQPTPIPSMEVPQTTASVTNFDILRRLNRLEKEVFGKQILDNDSAF